MPGEEAYNLSDMNKLTNDKSSSLKNGKGFYRSFVFKGIILASLVIVIVLLIVVIAMFSGSPHTNDLFEQCESLSAAGNTQICDACPSVSTSRTPITSTTVGTATSWDTTLGPTKTPKVKVDVRLPTALVPIIYDVRIRPDMYGPDPKEFNFTGSVTIYIECKESTDNVTLHINELNVSDHSIQVYGSGVNFTVIPERDTKRQFLILNLNQKMMAGGHYYVSMDFVGPLKDRLNGLYLSSYKRGNETIYLTASQFQTTDARKTFPCFDEPSIKARFNITLERKSDKTALSNMPVLWNETLKNGWVADHFKTSPKMSTYLLAFIVCDFAYIEAVTANNVKYRAWARPDAISQAEYALQVGVEILTFYEDFFNVSYPLPKQDMIALPDFNTGAMENWGLITYKETAMLYDATESSEGNLQWVTEIVTHELAHMWFGNLVTLDWWEDLWLNEGFASYMSYVAMAHLKPDWKMFEQFAVYEIHGALSLDGLLSSHPLFVPVADPIEIEEIFDGISYAKGAAVIRMAKFFLGDKTFQKGLTRYLKGLEYGVATRDDLWYAWGNQSLTDGKARINVKEVMDTWVLQMNFPVVTIERTNTGMHVKQERFLMDSNVTEPEKHTSPFGYKWHIPFTYTHEDETNFTALRINWMKRGDLDIFQSSLPGPADNKWVLANIEQYGYYRVNYDEHNWRQLIRQLQNNHSVIPTINRAQIINDAWNLASAGLLDMKVALDTMNYLTHERDYVPWRAAFDQLDGVDVMLQRHEMYGSFREFMTDSLKNFFGEMTLNNSGASHMESYRRSQVASNACHYGVPACVTEAKRLYAQWMKNPVINPIDPGVRFTVYCTAIRHGGVDEWDFAYERLKLSNVPGEKSRLRSAMSCSRETWILQRYLQRVLMPNEIRKQDAVNVIVDVSGNTIGIPLVWDFIRTNWPYFRKEYGGSFFTFARLIKGTTAAFNTEFELQQLHELKARYPDMGSGKRAFDQVIEQTKSDIRWMETNIPAIKIWLDNKKSF